MENCPKIVGTNYYQNKVDRTKPINRIIINKHKKSKFQKPKAKQRKAVSNVAVTKVSPLTPKETERKDLNETKTM